LDFIGLMANKVTGGIVPVPFVSFALVGAAGVAIHMVILKFGLMAGATFGNAQLTATLIAMISNFFVNNLVTYRDSKLKGLALIRGLIAFCCVCSLGAIANVGAAMWLYGFHQVWWLAGLMGVVMGAVWNYTLSSLIVWRRVI
jgi:dolichol-phosphate mannosyltransferase